MHVPASSDFPPEVRTALRRVLDIANGSREFEIALADLMVRLSEHASTTGYAEGMKEGRIRGRRKGRGLPEIAKPRGRPMSVDTIIKKLGGWPDSRVDK
jgi:hypothetical protein